MYRFFVFIFILACCTTYTPAEPTVTFANRLFLQGRHEEALAEYESLAVRYGFSADLYYNIGLCELNLHRIAKAKLAFEKALMLSPASRNIKLPLAQINSTIEPKIEPLPPFFLYKWFTLGRNIFNRSGWGWITLLTSIFLGILSVLNYGFKKPVPEKVRLAGFTFFLIGLVFYASRSSYEKKFRAILMESKPLNVAPEAKSQELLPLGAGTTLEIIDSLQSWYKVLLENNDQGWLPKQAIQKI